MALRLNYPRQVSSSPPSHPIQRPNYGNCLCIIHLLYNSWFYLRLVCHSVEATFARSHPSRFLFGCKGTSLPVRALLQRSSFLTLILFPECSFGCDAVSHPTQKLRNERPQYGSTHGREVVKTSACLDRRAPGL